jgi:CBS domain-containing protein/ribosome-associated translation inhibitor RaiA
MELSGNIRKATILEHDQPVSKVIGELSKDGTCVVVTKNRNYIGIIDDWTITRLDPTQETKVGSIAVRAPTVSTNATLLTICKLFSSGPYRALPVLDGKKIIGTIHRSEILSSLLNANLIPKKKVSELMKRNVPCIDANTSLAEAKSKIYGHPAGKLAVIKDNLIAGVLTAYDIASALNKPKDKLPFVREKVRREEVPVEALMRKEVYTISPDASLVESAQKMIEKDIAAIIVEEKMKPVGIISAIDLFQCAITPEEPDILISGLDESDKQYIEDIVADSKNFIKKIGKSFPIDYLSMHFKKYGKKYSIHGKLKTSKRTHMASSFGWDMQVALKSLLDEFKKMLLKGKRNKLHIKRTERS